MTNDDRKLKPWEHELKAALRRHAEHEAEAFLENTPDDYVSIEELAVQKAKLMARVQAMEAERKNQDGTAPSDEALPAEGASTLSPNIRALLERAGITLVARGRKIVLRLNQAALELLGGIYEPDAVRVRGVEDTLAEEVESALEGLIPVVATRLQVAEDGALLLDLQWVALAPEQAPGVGVEVGGNRARAAWDDWAVDYLTKTLRIEGGGIGPKVVVESAPVVELAWNEPLNLLRVWIETNPRAKGE